MAPQVKVISFADGLNVGYKRKRGVEGDSKIFGLSIWWNGAAIFWDGEDLTKSRFKGTSQEFIVGGVECEIPIRN